MMKSTNSQRCNTYGEAAKLGETATAKAQKDFGGKAEEKWKVRIRRRPAGLFDVKTYKYVEPPKKEVEKTPEAA